MKLLNKKIALITGGSGDIGQSIIKTFIHNGAKVIFTYLSSEEESKKLEKKFKELAKGYKVDVSNKNSCKIFLKEILHKYPNIDILVNNVGIVKDSFLIRMSDDKWDEVIQTNLYSVFQITKNVIYYSMIRQKKGNIINMSSVIGITGNIGQSNYAASKAGIIGFTKSIAKEFGKKNIRCNAIAPGYISTRMNSNLDYKTKANWINKIPLGRSGSPKEVSNCVLFLASELSSYITGTTLNVNGGMI
ncbi:3-oxoacyl-[acyl-carrier-protein] reductase [Blattabacterium cuenoti]|uniref:3-oxoacyl-[acyl-carrier-protein] reductase n=1 Tax=Blattabacterium cuenoti TaxID=1653831 RepID=UPI00163C2949|nr:3-oxoacyl-[acyl-carrier-protein] reductase [Blattabacterium cuenoti]